MTGEGNSQEPASSPKRRKIEYDRGSGSTFTPKQRSHKSIANDWWIEHLQPVGWRRFRPVTLSHDWGFVPVAYQSASIKEIKAYGEPGIHYALGWDELYEMVLEYGVFQGETLTDYVAPPFPSRNAKASLLATTTMFSQDDDATVDLSPGTATAFPPVSVTVTKNKPTCNNAVVTPHQQQHQPIREEKIKAAFSLVTENMSLTRSELLVLAQRILHEENTL